MSLFRKEVPAEHYPVDKPDAEWRRELPPEAYRVLRQHGTERPGSCALNFEKRAGTFSCVGCGQDLFTSHKKFESGTGWPSFDNPLPGAVEETTDPSRSPSSQENPKTKWQNTPVSPAVMITPKVDMSKAGRATGLAVFQLVPKPP